MVSYLLDFNMLIRNIVGAVDVITKEKLIFEITARCWRLIDIDVFKLHFSEFNIFK